MPVGGWGEARAGRERPPRGEEAERGGRGPGRALQNILSFLSDLRWVLSIHLPDLTNRSFKMIISFLGYLNIYELIINMKPCVHIKIYTSAVGRPVLR